MHIELSYLYPSNVPVFLNSISLRRVDFKLPGNLEILVISPLWQRLNGHEVGKEVLEKMWQEFKDRWPVDGRSFGINEF